MNHLLPQQRGARESLTSYQARGGYRMLEKAIARTPHDVIVDIQTSGLRGRGGAGYLTGLKWEQVAGASGDHYLVVNGAEGEPGSFKDRALMTEAPHRLLEGMLVASHAIGAKEIYLYINDLFVDSIASLRQAMDEIREVGLWGPLGRIVTPIYLVPETHVYIAGEETALINALMGLPAQPWHKPPYPTEKGFRGCPTVVNNVETLAAVPLALWEPGEFQLAPPMLFSISGDVRRPGVYEACLGVCLADLLDETGGPLEGDSWLALLPGGYSMPMIPAQALDFPLTHASFEERKSGLGASIIVIGQKTGVSRAVYDVLTFFQKETCGKCPMCVKGTEKLAAGWLPVLESGLTVEIANQVLTMAHKYQKKGVCSYLDSAARFAAAASEWVAL